MNGSTPPTDTPAEAGPARAAPHGADRPGPWVVCEKLSRHYGSGTTRVVAVEDVSATVSSGMRLALTGPSGSGKSTLLHLMAGLDTPTAGRIAWPGLDAAAAGRPDAVAVVFQGPSLLPELDVAENVALPLLLGERSRRSPDDTDPAPEVAVAAALHRVGIGELGDKLPEELSGGQAQRVALARVLVTRPRLILADEPTGQLDRETGRLVITALLDTADELDAALVVATHDPTVAERLTQRWHMHDGRLETSPPGPTLPDRTSSDPSAGAPS